ncbi:uncharacterized protein [Coffea arabica]|uniref:RNase H type-1 domain-containing protein n=1 Tax=Coffea arabica TaxID=13443 RepID=A0A6P6VJI7_COFAR
MLVKSRTQEQFISDLREIFEVLRSSRMRLNPKKCTFGVKSGKFLGYMISKEGVRANPDKIKAIMDMAPPRNIKEVQRLTGRMAALNRFLSKSAVRGSPFFKALKGEYDLGYQPRTAIKAQVLADFIADGVSFGSPEAEVDQARDIQARKDGEAIQVAEVGPSKEAAEAEQAKEAAEGEQAREAAKAKQTQETAEVGQAGEAAEVGQALNAAEAEHSGKAVKAELARETAQGGKVTEATGQADPTWTLYVDGASSKEGCGAGLLLISPTGEELPYALWFKFRAFNNESEYEALIAGMEMARKLGARSIKVYSDSQLIVNQIPRSQNKRADALSKLASTSVGVLGREILVEVLRSRAYEPSNAAVIQVMSSWMDPIVQYLAHGELPPSRVEARKVLLKSQKYVLTHGVLYRKSYLQPWLKCVTPEKGSYVLRELHEGICGNHVGPRVLAKKGMLAGYYWPTIFRDSAELVVGVSLASYTPQSIIPPLRK